MARDTLPPDVAREIDYALYRMGESFRELSKVMDTAGAMLLELMREDAERAEKAIAQHDWTFLTGRHL